MFDPVDDVLDRARRELRQPVATDPARKARIMELVRASAARGSRAGVRRWGHRSGWTAPLVQLGLAAGIASIVVASALRPLVSSRAAIDPVTGEAVMHDSVAATLRDTLRLVRFMLVDPAASRVTLAGDFNDWNVRNTPLVRAESAGVWSVAVALAPGRHRYTFVVDDTQWVPDPSAPRLSSAHGDRPASVVTVARNPN